MRGFILRVQRVRDEDLIVTILSREKRVVAYRFYGARHSIVQLGHLIDFELEESVAHLPQLRSISHFGFEWLSNRERLRLWHELISLLEAHLKDADSVDTFYFDMLLKSAKIWEKQNPKRVIVELIVMLLKREGRLYDEQICFVCEQPLGEKITLMQALRPAHSRCVFGIEFLKKDIFRLFNETSTMHLDDNSVENILNIINSGI